MKLTKRQIQFVIRGMREYAQNPDNYSYSLGEYAIPKANYLMWEFEELELLIKEALGLEENNWYSFELDMLNKNQLKIICKGYDSALNPKCRWYNKKRNIVSLTANQMK